MRALLASVLSLGLLSGCSSTEKAPPQTVGALDLQRYQGQWYEQARLPLFFQRKCITSQADYQLNVDGTVQVLNSCQTADGSLLEARAEARLVDGYPDRLKVRFDNFFSRLFPGLTEGDYWVLYVDPDYQVAVVGHPEHKYLWLLTRDQALTAERREVFLALAKARGYDNLDELIWRGELAP